MQRWLQASLAALTMSICAGASAAPTLSAFANESELNALFAKWREDARARRDERRRQMSADAQPASPSSNIAQAPMAAEKSKADDSVTNVQHAGVDEGGIVKTHGDHLVVLRRGRLFTVAIGDRALAPVSVADAFGPGIDPRGAWYDEMLVSEGRVIVIGYSYARGGTEIGVFAISPAGRLAHQATYHLRSNDYYSSRNYASRLIGSKLVFYTPLAINAYADDPTASFPAMRRWNGAASGGFRRIAPATRIYRADDELDPFAGIALHTVTSCDLAKPELDCQSTAVMGGIGRVFYVSPEAVYVWTTNGSRRARGVDAPSAVFRMPLDGSAPTALKVAGSPIDQFSFLEADGHLNVLVRSVGRGDGMWAGERNVGDLGLLRVPVASFTDGRASAPREAYRALPRPQQGAIQSRYIGAYLVYGAGAGWGRPNAEHDGAAFAVRYAEPASGTYTIALAHGVDRIEALGADAVAIGSDGRDLHFTSLRLGRHAVLADRFVRPNASQGETRSHGFFYRASDDRSGLVGLPIIGGGESAAGQLRRASASVLYLKNEALKLTALGALDARPADTNDGCRASCVDWYGNSRPLFLRGRVFTLMGYEIVEGRLEAGRIVETRRIDLAPRAAIALR